MAAIPWHARIVADWPVHPAAPIYSGTRDLTLDLYAPQQQANGLVIYIHGGGWQEGSKDRPPGYRAFLAAGYAVAAIEYRFTTQTDAQSLVGDVTAGIEAARALAAREWHADQPWYLWGISAGGHLASLAAHTLADRPTAVVSWCGPMDLVSYGALAGVKRRLRSHVRTIVSQLVGDDLEQAKLLSPVTHAGPTSVPHLFVHGTADGLVPIEQSRTMYDALLRSGVAAELYRVEGGDHAMPPSDWSGLDRTIAFLQRHRG